MKSENNKNLLYDYVNDLLSDNDKAEFEKQLAQSVDLQNDLKRVKQYYSLVKSSEPSEVPRDFIERVHSKIGVFNDLPYNEKAPVFRAAASAPSVRRVNEQTPENLQIEKKKNNPLKLRFKQRFPFEIAGVLATVVILVFVFIPNVNSPQISRKTVFDESAVQEFEKNKLTDDKQMQMEADKAASETVVPEPAASFDKKVTDNLSVSVKDKAKKKDVPKSLIVQRTTDAKIADKDEKREEPAPASPVPSATLSMTGNSVEPATKEEAKKLAVPAIAPAKPVAERTNADIIAMSSTMPEEKQASEPVRIILRGAVSSDPVLSTAPSSMQSEGMKMKARRSERSMSRTSKTQIAENENIAGKPSGADVEYVEKVDKNKIESMFSENNITWGLVLIEENRLLYRVHGTEQAVKSVIDKLKSAGFIQINMPLLNNDSVDVELEINY